MGSPSARSGQVHRTKRTDAGRRRVGDRPLRHGRRVSSGAEHIYHKRPAGYRIAVHDGNRERSYRRNIRPDRNGREDVGTAVPGNGHIYHRGCLLGYRLGTGRIGYSSIRDNDRPSSVFRGLVDPQFDRPIFADPGYRAKTID